MVNAFDDFYETGKRVDANSADTPTFVIAHKLRVTLVTVAMALYNFARAVHFFGQAAFSKITIVITKAHSTTGVFFALLVFHGGNNWVSGLRINFRGVSIAVAMHAGGSYNRHVQAIAKA